MKGKMKEQLGHKPTMNIKSDVSMKVILEASPIGIVVFDHEARVLYTNPLADTIFDTAPDKATGRRCGDYIRCAHRKTALQGCGHSKKCQECPVLRAICDVCSGTAATETVTGEAYLDRGPNLPEIWVKYRVVSIAIDGFKAAVMAVEDITIWKNDQEKLRNLMVELSAIHENAPIAMMLMDRDRRVRKVNGFATKFADRTAVEMIGLTGGEALRCLHHLDDPKGCGFGPACAQCQVRQAVLDTFATGVSQKDVAAWLPFPRGEAVEERYLLISTAFLEISGTERVLVCAQDMTEWKRAEKALQESEDWFRAAVEGAPDAVFVQTGNRFAYLNSRALQLFGATNKDELLGQPVIDRFHPDFHEKVLERSGQLNDERQPDIESFEQKYLRLDGSEVWVETTGQPIVYQGKNGALIFVRDITARKQAEAEQERYESQLQQAQKMETVGRLAGGVAHDFNNMLGVILGYSEMALGQISADQPIYKAVQRIQQAAQRSADLTSQLLAFARKQAIAPRVIDLNETVEGMLKMLRRLIGEDTDLIWLPGRNIQSVKMDPAQIDQILANLCVNARDAIAGEGKVIIETGVASVDEDWCAVHTEAEPGEYVLLAVSDNGCGMDQETISHLFEPFFTTKDQGKGTGLGLASVYGAVKQNNGFITVDSEPGQGTTFKIYLPQYVIRTEPLPIQEPVGPAARGHETILLVEDEPTILEMTAVMLERLGYNVLAASSPKEAIRLAGKHSGRIDLLMTDVVMPGMNGRELAENLLALYPALKRLFMSGYTDNVIAHHGVLDKGVHFIQKPFSMQDLGTKLREALAG
jgi:PAS domain S-box-containing protein